MSAVAEQRDPGPMARLFALKADQDAPSMIFQRMSDGEFLDDIAKSLKLPKGLFIEWFQTTHADRYAAGHRALAEGLHKRLMEIVDTVTPETVAVARVQSDVILKLMAKLNRQVYGESVRVEKDVTVRADAALLGTAAALLGKVRELQAPRVVQGLVLDGAGMTMAPRPELGPI